MFEKKCPGCAKKIEKEFSYCPWCGTSIKEKELKENYGLLGKDDSIMNNIFKNNFGGLPMGMDKIINSLTKQIEKEMSNMNSNNANISPKGFSIKISTGMPSGFNPMNQQPQKQKAKKTFSEDKERIGKFKQIEPESKIRRLGDKILYEIKTPGIKNKSDVAIKELEQGIEIKAYAENKCYTKVLPINMDLSSYKVEKDKVIFEFETE